MVLTDIAVGTWCAPAAVLESLAPHAAMVILSPTSAQEVSAMCEGRTISVLTDDSPRRLFETSPATPQYTNLCSNAPMFPAAASRDLAASTIYGPDVATTSGRARSVTDRLTLATSTCMTPRAAKQNITDLPSW